MKRFFAAFVAIWYLVSTMGLDIHHDHEHGKIYIVPALLAQSCEMIHPHEHCHDEDVHGCHCGCCCNDEGCEEDEDCCTDDFESVSITGTDPGSEQQIEFQAPAANAVFATLILKPSLSMIYGRAFDGGKAAPPLDIPVRNCVMRS